MQNTMKKWINYSFESSSSLTPEFAAFSRSFKQYLTRVAGSEYELDYNRGHFEASAFFRNKQSGKFAYISISDVRFFPNSWVSDILIRTAEHRKDYHGGRNDRCALEDIREKLDELTALSEDEQPKQSEPLDQTQSPTAKLLAKIKRVKTLYDLEALGFGRVECDISYRGGGVGFYGSSLAKILDIDEDDLPRNYGAGCNYLGDGVRGSIFPSGYSDRITGKKAQLLDELAAACIRVYTWIEDQESLNDEEDEDGTNWDAVATNRARKAGIVSAY